MSTGIISNLSTISIYALPVAAALLYMVVSRRKTYETNREVLEENIKTGLTEPPSLHPVINPDRCIGCAVCVPACPEGNVLGLVDGKVELINATQCIGHGACKAACPVDAITLVFGTAKRGMDIPNVNEYFETNVSGIYIAGELGGMGLIRNAIRQGREAMENIANREDVKSNPGEMFDCVIVGAGPAGITAALTAKQAGVRYLVVEQEVLGGTIAHFPRGKVVMTVPFELPGIGKFNFREVSKEELMQVWIQVEQQAGLNIRYKEKMEKIIPVDGGFHLQTNAGTYPTKTVLLAIGRRGTPRKLGVPGEEGSPKVIYSLTDPELYRGKHVLVVGGGNSALEAAHSLADEPGTTVTLSYRSGSFSRAAKKNRQKVEEREASGRLTVMLHSNVKEIRPETVVLEKKGEVIEIPNDIVIVNAGGVLPIPMLKEVGIEVETKYGTE